MRSSDEESQGPVIRDRRRIDPVTGQVRDQAGWLGQPGAPAAPRGQGQPRPGRHTSARPAAGDIHGGGSGQTASAAPASPPGTYGGAGGQAGKPGADGDTAAILAERTADLQRLQAEYANYRKRVERDRTAVREQALASVLGQLLPVLDDIGRAREHGELIGGFKQVAESLETAAAKLGLTTYGETGDAFDPTLHEALMHSYSPEVTEPTCVRILQPGYKVGERILRPARVAVAEPGDPDGGDPDGGGPDGGQPDGETGHPSQDASREAGGGRGSHAARDGD